MANPAINTPPTATIYSARFATATPVPLTSSTLSVVDEAGGFVVSEAAVVCDEGTGVDVAAVVVEFE